MLRRAERPRARSRARRAPRVREGGRRSPRDEQLRRQSPQADAVRAGGAGATSSIARAAQLAREAAGDRALVAGAVGPLGVRLEPYGPTSTEEARAIFREQTGGAEGGRRRPVHPRDVLATWTRSSRPFTPRATSTPTMPVIAQMTIGTDGRTPYGASPEDVARALDRCGRRRHRAQLLRRPADDSRGDREDGAGHDAQAQRAAERRHAARRRRAQDVHGQPRVHGDVRAAPRAGGREGHRRLLRDDARAHQRDGRGHSSARAAAARASSQRRERGHATSRRCPKPAGRGRRAGAASRERSKLGAARSRAASSSRRSRSCRRAASTRRKMLERRRQRSKRAGVDAVNVPDGPRAQSRMGALLTSAAHRAAGRHRDGHALLLPRPQSARHAERSARRRGDRAAQHAAHHRRPAEDGPVPERDGGVRHRRDRPDEPRAAT